MLAGISYRKFLSLVTGLGLALLLGSVLTSTAWAAAPNGLYVDVYNNGTAPPPTPTPVTNIPVAVTSSGAVVTSLIQARVVGTDGDTTNDYIGNFVAAFYSTNGGLIKGDLSLAFTPIASIPFTAFRQNGTAQNLDGDGDKDLGSTDNSTTTGWVVESQAPGFVYANTAYGGRLTFTGTSWGPAIHGVTQIWAVGQVGTLTSYWSEDDTTGGGAPPTTFGTIKTGTMVTLYRPAAAVVGPTLNITPGNQSGNLGGTGSTGTIKTWEWVINGVPRGTLTGDTPLVTLATLMSWGLGDLDGETYPVALNLTSDYETIAQGTGSIFVQTPEPATLALLAFGGLAMIARRRRSA